MNSYKAKRKGGARRTPVRKWMEEAQQKSAHDLEERVKELSCLYGISDLAGKPDISLEEVLQGTVDLIRSAWQYPEITCARVILDGQEFTTDNFGESAWQQTSDIIVHGERAGAVQVCYLEERPEEDEGPFLKEERRLLDAIAERLGRIIEQHRAERRLEHLNSVLSAIRNVNQLIAVEKDRDRLLQGACDNLVDTRGYHCAWIALINESGEFVTSAEVGLGEDFLPLVELLKRGELTACGRKAFGQPGVVTTENPAVDCADCPLAGSFGGGGRMTVRLEHGGKVYGLLVVSVPKDFVGDDEEQALFLEVAGDIAFALHNMELEEGRKQAEEALRESEEQYSLLVGNLADAVFRFKEGVISWGNDRMREMLGYDKDEMIGDDVNLFVPDETSLSEIYREVDAELKKEGRFHGTTRAKKKDGSIIDIEYSASQVPGKDPIEIVGVARDITERKQAEEALRESEERFRHIFNSVNDEIIYIDTDGVVLNVNEKIRDIFGYLPAEMIGRNILELNLFDPDELSKLSELMMASVEQGGAQSPMRETQARHRDGHVVPLEVSTSLMTAADGTPEGFVSIIRDITERRRMEGELLVKENAIENSINAMAISDIQGNITYVNRACMALWRKNSKAEILGKSYWELLELEDAAVAQDIARAMIENGSWEGELVVRRKDGSEINVQVLTAVIKDEKGNPVQTMSSFIDVTERTRAEEALRASENKLRAIFETMSDGLAVTDVFGNIVEANDALIRLHGYSQKGELIGKRTLDVVAEKDKARTAEDIGKAIGEGNTALAEYALITSDGGEVEVEASASLLLDGSGNPAGLVGVLRDITERKQAEKALRESEEQFRDLFENANDLIQSIDVNGRFVYVNKKWMETLGYKEKEVKKLRLSGILREDQIPHCMELFRRVCSGEPLEKVETVFVNKDGREVYVEGDVSARFKDGRFVSTRGIFRDVTERRQAEEAKRELDRLKSEFISNTSHELRTPLQSIMGFTKLMLREKVPDPETQREFLSIIDKQSTRLAELINDLLDVSRMESGRFTIQKQPLSVGDVIQGVVRELDGIAHDGGIAIVGDVPAALPEIEADEKRIKQVIVNLLGNALKFSDSGGEIKVSAEVKDDEILVSVSDRGMGIPAEAIPHLFERFYQVDGSMTRSSSGSGLGLYISAQIVEAHGGRIWAESKVGKGSTFSFTLPLSPTDYQGGGSHEKESVANRG